MRGLQHEVLGTVYETRLLLRVGSPQKKNNVLSPIIELSYDSIGEALPSTISMRARLSLFYGQNCIEQKDSLPSPRFQAPVLGAFDTEIALKFEEDIDERWRRRRRRFD
jgi:hypothetical protein